MLFQPSVLCSQLQNLCTTIIHFLSLNELSDRLWLIWALPACLSPGLVPSLPRDSFWTPQSKTSAVLHTRNHLKKGTSLTAKPVFGTQWHLDGPSGAKGCLSRTVVDHLVKKSKYREANSPHSIWNTENGFTPILLMEERNSEFETKITI